MSISEITIVLPPPTMSFNQEVILISLKGGEYLPRDIGEKINSPFYEIKTATLYPILNRLQKNGFIRSKSIEGKRVYSLTNKGEELIETTEKIRRIVSNEQNNNDPVQC